MSLFQCQVCGCVENTALSSQGCAGFFTSLLDWTGKEASRGKLHCSSCAPTKYADGTPTGLGKWHGRFPRTYLPKDMFVTNAKGNIEHIETKSEDYHTYKLYEDSL